MNHYSHPLPINENTHNWSKMKIGDLILCVRTTHADRNCSKESLGSFGYSYGDTYNVGITL